MALVFFAALVLVLLYLRAGLARQEEQVAYNMTALSWKVSETLLETDRLTEALQLHELGEAERSDITLAAEILWSRVLVLQNSELQYQPQLAAKVSEYSSLLIESEPALYDAPELPPDISQQIRARFETLNGELRSVWIGDFLGNRGALTRAATSDLALKQTIFEITILACLAALLLYLSMELRAAHLASKHHEKMRHRATEASAAKTTFLANVSHEIRTPLNGVIGMAQELRESGLTQEQADLVDVIVTSGDLLLHTINDVLDLSKVEAGQMEMEEIAFDPVERISGAIRLYARLARDKGLTLQAEFSEGMPKTLIGDPLRLVQVVNNLLSNAIKFTETGGVSVTVRSAPPVSGAPIDLWIDVRDTGVGISHAALSGIFTPFSQADSSTTRKHGGTGLGLTISRNICALMGGDLSVVSAKGHGATFTVYVRLTVPETLDASHDVLTTRVVVTGSDERSRSEQARQVDPSDAPKENRLVPVDKRPQSAARPDQTHAPGPGDLRILIVDDSDINRLVLRKFVGGQAAELVEATSGREAVAAAAAQRFDLILMDVQMPEMDGMEATGHIRAAEREMGGPPIPIVAVTANVISHQVESYLDAGFDRVVAKPVRKAELLDLIADVRSAQAA